MRDNEGVAMSKVADKIMACVHGGDELRDLLGHKPDVHIIKNMEDVFGEVGHFNLFSEIARQIRQEESEMRDFCERVEDATKNKEELDLFGVAYTPLPLDANGVPVRVGDMLQGEHCCDGWCEPFEVYHLRLYCTGWLAHEKNGTGHIVDRCRHYHAPTVEDVLREFASERIKLILSMPVSMSDEEIKERLAENSRACERLIAEFADKLRLKDES